MSGSAVQLKEEEKEQIIRDFLPFIKYNAYRLAWRLPPQLTVDDLISVGVMGLLDALGRYREGMVKLNTFVEFRIKGAMLDELRAQDPVPKSMKKKIDDIKKENVMLEKKLGRMPEHEEIAESLKLSLDDYFEILQNANSSVFLRFEDFRGELNDDTGIDITECIADPEAKDPLTILEENKRKETLAGLIEKLPEKEKLILSLYYWEEMTMKEIALTLNLTEGRVSQLHNQALIRMKAKLHPDSG